MVDRDKIVKFDKFKHNGKDFKYFYGYTNDEIIRHLCIVLPQMSGYIKYFYDGGKICLKIEDDNILIFGKKIKKTLNTKFHSQPVYDKKYIKTNVKTFNDLVNTVFIHITVPK